MKKFTLVFLLLPCLAYSQKVYVSADNVLTIDTVIQVPGMDKEKVFNSIKKWAVLTIPNFNSQLQGEVQNELLKVLYITDYAAAAGTRQKYKQDLIFSLGEEALTIRINNLYTHVPGQKGMSANKFFINKGTGELKPAFSKFYLDVAKKFKSLTREIAENSVQ